MYLIIESIIAIVFPAYLVLEMFRINFLKKDDNALIAGLVSMISIGYGLFLLVSNGLILDYGTPEEIVISKAEFMGTLGYIDVLSALIFVALSITKWIFSRK